MIGGHINTEKIFRYEPSYPMYSLQIAADNAVFGQTGPKVGSFDAGYGSTQMARLVGGVTNDY